ncbi:MAG TPA: histidine phosphatase family protein [Caulobacteraceae bacterium]|nr:histidine phosphatase family protein [Caulobacteraceae bacterium]
MFLIRHCQSEANREGRIEGRGDSPLSELGQEQARRVARFMADLQIDAVTMIASPLSRAAATAAEIAAHGGWSVSHDHRIREGELGWMEDLSYQEVAKHMAERGARVLDAEIHGGESLETVAERVWEALSEAMAASDGALIAVTHGYAIHALARRLGHEMGLAGIANGDVVEIWFEGDTPTGPPTHHALEG